MTIPWLSTHFDHPYPHRPVAKIGATKGQETSHPGSILVRELGTVVEGLIGQLLLVGCWDEAAIGRLIKSSQPLSRCFHALSSPSSPGLFFRPATTPRPPSPSREATPPCHLFAKLQQVKTTLENLCSTCEISPRPPLRPHNS